jgi:hypothetical protein
VAHAELEKVEQHVLDKIHSEAKPQQGNVEGDKAELRC